MYLLLKLINTFLCKDKNHDLEVLCKISNMLPSLADAVFFSFLTKAAGMQSVQREEDTRLVSLATRTCSYFADVYAFLLSGRA